MSDHERDRFYVVAGSFSPKPTLHIHKNAVPKQYRTTGVNILCGRGRLPTEEPTNEQLMFGKICPDCQRKFNWIEEREGNQREVG